MRLKIKDLSRRRSLCLEGEALKIEERYDEALVPLKRAATMIPAPLNKRAWRSLSECYRNSGRQELAEIADLVVNAEEQQPAERSPQPVVRIAFVPLPMLSQALRELFVGTEASQSNIASDVGTGDENAAASALRAETAARASFLVSARSPIRQTGRMLFSKIDVGSASVQQALGMSTMPLTRPSQGQQLKSR